MTQHFRGELLPHQREGLEFLLAQPRCVLADEVGLGKTVQVAALIGALADSGQLRRPTPAPEDLGYRSSVRMLPPLPVLWITSAGLVQQAVSELERFLPGLAVVPVLSGLTGNRTDRERMVKLLEDHPNGPDVIVTTHALADSRRQPFEDLRPVVVVVDEASALKGAGSRHEAVRYISEASERVIAMTATPYENDPMEFWAVLDLVGLPDLYSAEEFGSRYVEWRVFDDGSRKPLGWRSPNHARSVMWWVGERFLRRTPDQIGQSLPRRVDSWMRLVPLSSTQRSEYVRASYRKHWGARHQGMAKAARVGSDGVSSLLDAAVAEVAALAATGNKVVLYVEHLDLLAMAEKALEERGVGCVSIQGDDNKAERTDAVERFRDDPSVAVLLGTKVLEHGLNLQFANVLVSAGVTHNPARERQREGRLCRIGSPNATYRHLVFIPDTDQTRAQLATLRRKSTEAAPVLGSGLSG